VYEICVEKMDIRIFIFLEGEIEYGRTGKRVHEKGLVRRIFIWNVT